MVFCLLKPQDINDLYGKNIISFILNNDKYIKKDKKR